MSSSNFNPPPATGNVFWGEIAPCEHMAQFYEHEGVLVDTLIGFVGGGLKTGESAIVIATAEHLKALEKGLVDSAVDLAAARLQDRYVTLLADEALSRFMIKDWPDDELFAKFVSDVIMRARGNGRSVRAFGEMVALLWAKGQTAATVRLEFLWNQLCKSQNFSLFCAYPKAGFTEATSKSLQEICAAHSRIM